MQMPFQPLAMNNLGPIGQSVGMNVQPRPQAFVPPAPTAPVFSQMPVATERPVYEAPAAPTDQMDARRWALMMAGAAAMQNQKGGIMGSIGEAVKAGMPAYMQIKNQNKKEAATAEDRAWRRHAQEVSRADNADTRALNRWNAENNQKNAKFNNEFKTWDTEFGHGLKSDANERAGNADARQGDLHQGELTGQGYKNDALDLTNKFNRGTLTSRIAGEKSKAGILGDSATVSKGTVDERIIKAGLWNDGEAQRQDNVGQGMRHKEDLHGAKVRTGAAGADSAESKARVGEATEATQIALADLQAQASQVQIAKAKQAMAQSGMSYEYELRKLMSATNVAEGTAQPTIDAAVSNASIAGDNATVSSNTVEARSARPELQNQATQASTANSVFNTARGKQLLPGQVAIQDNQVEAGDLANGLSSALFEDRVMQGGYATDAAAQSLDAVGQKMRLAREKHPGIMQAQADATRASQQGYDFNEAVKGHRTSILGGQAALAGQGKGKVTANDSDAFDLDLAKRLGGDADNADDVIKAVGLKGMSTARTAYATTMKATGNHVAAVEAGMKAAGLEGAEYDWEAMGDNRILNRRDTAKPQVKAGGLQVGFVDPKSKRAYLGGPPNEKSSWGPPQK